MRRVRAGVGAGLILVIPILISGCGHRSEDPIDARVRAQLIAYSKEARTAGYREQAEALADGRFTDAENRSLFSLFRECLSKAGYEITDPAVNPIDGRSLEWKFVDEDSMTAADNAPTHRCQDQYIGSNAAALAEAPRPMAPHLRRAIAECLIAAGLDASPEVPDLRAVLQRVGDDEYSVMDRCIGDAVSKQYPDRPRFGIILPTVY